MLKNLSACVILRVPAEEPFLHASLSSFRPLTEDLYILDMGQHAFAERFAEEYGARVVRVHDQPHEAAMLNIMLKEANKEWLIWMDADEFILEGHALIGELVQDGKTKAASVRAIHFEDPVSTFDEPRTYRLLNLQPDSRFLGTIDPQLVLPEDRGAVVDSEIKIAHRAYMQDEIIIQKNHLRVKNFSRHLEEHPDDRFARNKLGYYLMAIREWGKALEQQNILIESDPNDPENPLFMLRAATCALSLNDSELALQYVERAIEQQPNFSDAYFMLGTILVRHNRLDEAKAALQQALERKAKTPYYLLADESMSTWKPLNELAEISRRENRLLDAVRFLERSLEVYPTNYRTNLMLASLYKQLNRPEDAKKAYQAAITINPAILQKKAVKP
ncbi:MULTISPECIES: tetratricopeptide repeat protein [Bacillales]|uniref:tetratricopeptide repeat-containing glycosyltransferase n=1 Tax=Brevibacillus TaxID=55080 RepID=UPI000E38E092|nr:MULTISPECIES: tetratricopeptide repeat protein [Bacillales]NNV01742.1 tetratricopeptide repeat protein [Brevibacillus sp. MCWH]REK68089.1 MAG: hypothetical protein DF221_00245 [Brevibacillus sp.]UFJ60884.1 tetratricopeptide repeat protein [Anoxybacillus sediminis]